MSKRQAIAALVGMLAFGFVTLSFWMTGFNFDERGQTAFFWFTSSSVATFFAVSVVLIGVRQ